MEQRDREGRIVAYHYDKEFTKEGYEKLKKALSCPGQRIIVWGPDIEYKEVKPWLPNPNL